MTRLALAALALVTLPAAAGADSRSHLTLGLGLHGSYAATGSASDKAGAFGLGARLKFTRYFGFDVAYDVAAEGSRPSPTAKADELVVSPDLRLSWTAHPIPNRFFSPLLTLGAGWNTGPWSLALMAGGGAEVEITRNLVAGAEVRMLFPDPRDVGDHVERRMKSSRGAGALPSTGDYYKPRAWLLTVGLTWYL